jgi:hypothetical protein
VIEREFGVVYHQNYISRLLDDLGWSVQKPDPRAIERDEELDPRLVEARLAKDKKRRGGSAQRSYLKMNLGSPMPNRSASLGRRKARHLN